MKQLLNLTINNLLAAANITFFSSSSMIFSNNSTNSYNCSESLINYQIQNTNSQNKWFTIGNINISNDSEKENYGLLKIPIKFLNFMDGNPNFQLDYKIGDNALQTIYSDTDNNFSSNTFNIFFAKNSLYGFVNNEINDIIFIDLNLSLYNFDPIKKQKENWYNVILKFSINTSKLINVNSSIDITNNNFELNIPTELEISNNKLNVLKSETFQFSNNINANNYVITNLLNVQTNTNSFEFFGDLYIKGDNIEEETSSSLGYLENSNTYTFYINNYSYFDDKDLKTYINKNGGEKGLELNYYQNDEKINFSIKMSLSNTLIHYSQELLLFFTSESIFQKGLNNSKYETNNIIKDNSADNINFNKDNINKNTAARKWLHN